MATKILILGGTQFIGRNLVEQLQKMKDCEITLFNRQKTESHLFPNLSKIKGDRSTDDIKQIAKTSWNFIIDLSCYYPNQLLKTLENIKGNLSKYIFISTCSVYDHSNQKAVLLHERASIYPCTADQSKDQTNRTYGNRKAECERILQQSKFNHVILRPSLVYGQYDHTDRFYYWLYQAKNHETLLLPDWGERKFSLTYVVDLINAIILLLNTETTSHTFNIISNTRISIREIVTTAINHLNKNPIIINAPPDFLHQHKISQWTDMPLWIDNDDFTYSNQRLIEELDIEIKDFQEGLTKTIAHYQDLGWPKPKYGIPESTRQTLIRRLQE